MTPYRILYAARQDALRAERRLDREHPGYGPAFADEFRAGVLAVLERPLGHPLAADGPAWLAARECYLRRFRHRLVYALDGETVIFLAVIHAKRRPRSWWRRLAGFH